MRKSILLLAVLPLMFFSCDDEEKTTVTVSAKSGTIYNGDETEFTVDVSGTEIREITFYFNNASIGSVIGKPYTVKFTPRDIEPGQHLIVAKVKTKSNKEIRAETSVSLSLRLGDEFQGGKIFYLTNGGGYALISAKSDMVIKLDGNSNLENFSWGEQKLLGTSDGGGKLNTKKIAEASSSSIQAGFHFKSGYEFNGYSDWYIPSISELGILKANKQFANEGFSDSTLDALSMYWSSSEVQGNKDEAFCLNMNVGEQVSRHRLSQYRVRPIREYVMK